MSVLGEHPRFDLSALGAHHVALLGKLLRDRTSASRDLVAVAETMVELLWDTLRHDEGARSVALARVFCTTRFHALEAEAQAAARALARGELAPEVPCLTLLATRGLEPAWNDPRASRGHRAIPLPTPAAVEQLPMISALLRQLGIDVAHVVRGDRDIMTRASERSFSAFYVPAAVDSPYVPAQSDFVVRYGVASAFGFGGVLPSGEVFATIVFSRVAVPEATARAFETLALHLRLAMIDAGAERWGREVALRSRVAALDQLLIEQQGSLVEWATRLAGERDRERAAHAQTVARRAEELRAKNVRLEETQRQLEGLVEELRLARTQLEQRVAERTAELQVANRAFSESNKELEQFAYVASHDLQEPLRTVIGHLQILEERYGPALDADGHEFIGFAISGARRMQALIESLLLYSRVTTQAREHLPVPLDEVLADVREGLAVALGESGAALEVGPLPVVHGDRVQLRQLFQNLVSNSIKFAGDRPPRIEISGQDLGEECEIVVADHGLGFHPRFAEAVFKVFRRLRRDRPGTGIGLAIVRKIVERHQGTVRAEASPGEGARFTIRLPSARRAGAGVEDPR